MKFWPTELDLYSVISKRKIKTSTSSTDIVQTDATKSSTTKHDLFDKDILCHGRKHNVLCSIKNVFIILFHFFKF